MKGAKLGNDCIGNDVLAKHLLNMEIRRAILQVWQANLSALFCCFDLLVESRNFFTRITQPPSLFGSLTQEFLSQPHNTATIRLVSQIPSILTDLLLLGAG